MWTLAEANDLEEKSQNLQNRSGSEDTRGASGALATLGPPRLPLLGMLCSLSA